MKRGLILFILMLFPCFGVFAQEQDDEIPVIPIYIDAQFGDTTEATNAIIQQLSAVLESHANAIDGIDFQLETVPEFAAISINVDLLEEDDLLFIDVRAIPPDGGLFPTPNFVGHPYSEFPLAIDPANPLWQEIMTELILGLGAYIVGDCEHALPHFGQVAALTAQQTNYYFLGQLEQTRAYTQFYEANCAVMNEDYPRAADIYHSILQLYQDNGFDMTLYGLESRINLAWVDYELGDVDHAIDALTEVEGSQFDWVETDAMLMRASIFADNGNLDDALNDLEDIQKSLNVDDPYLLLRTAFVRILAEDFYGADSDLSQVEKLAPELTDTLYYRGFLAYFEEDDTTALEYFYSYLEADPDGVYADYAESYIEELDSGS